MASRLERDIRTIQSLKEHLPEMTKVIEHHRPDHPTRPEEAHDRRLKQCLAVMVWEEPDGSESIVVVGDERLEDLGLKGILHDAVYALSHEMTHP
jgi:hypothetical protein